MESNLTDHSDSEIIFMKPGKDRFAEDPRRPPKLRSRVSFNNPVALANYEDLRKHAEGARKMVWRDKGEPARELISIIDVAEHAARGALRAGAIGFCMRSSLNLVLALMRLRKTKAALRMYMLRIAAIGTDSWGSAAMLASFVGIYKFLLNLFPIMFSVSSQPRKSIFSMPLSPGGLDVMDVQDLASGLTVPSIVDYTPSPVEDNLTVILADDIPPGHLSRAAEAHLEWVRRKTQRWQAVVAGGIAGGVAIMFEQKDRRPGIASQLLVRGLQGFWNAYSGMYGLTIPHGDVLVFCGSCAFIMYAHFMAPERLDPTYTHWIQNLSNIAPESVIINRQLLREGKFSVELLEKIIARRDTTAANLKQLLSMHEQVTGTTPDWSPHYSICAEIHPMNDSCLEIPPKRMLQVAKRMFPVYAALTFVPLILFRSKLLAKSPFSMLFKGSKDTLRSTLFISAFVTYYQSFVCFKFYLYKVFSKKPWAPRAPVDFLKSKWALWIGGIVSGLSILIEKPARRAELACYVLPKGLETMWLTAMRHGWALKRDSRSDFLFNAVAMGMVMGTYQNDPQHLSNLVRSILYQLVGAN